MFIEIGFKKEVWVFKIFFNLFIFGFLFILITKNYDLYGEESILELDYVI